jgi:hypothetical protein
MFALKVEKGIVTPRARIDIDNYHAGFGAGRDPDACAGVLRPMLRDRLRIGRCQLGPPLEEGTFVVRPQGVNA